MIVKVVIILTISVTLSKARFVDTCESLGYKNFNDANTDNNSNNVFCLNSTDLTVYQVNILQDSKV